jgi:cbb3-type cytochrome oxidase subunit 3
MKEKLQGVLGTFGIVLYFIITFVLCFIPVLFWGLPRWVDFIYIAVFVFLGGTWIAGLVGNIAYIIAFINVIQHPIDAWAVVFLVAFAINVIYFVVNILPKKRNDQ